MKNLKVSLYDILGYLFPGLIFFGGLVLFYSTFLNGSTIVSWNMTDSIVSWVALIVVCYILGHSVQAIAGLLLRRKIPQNNPISEEVISNAKAAIANVYGIELTDTLLNRYCKSIVNLYGDRSNADTYIHREGFYRGGCVGFMFLTIMFIPRLFCVEYVISGTLYTMNIGTTIVLIILFVSVTLLFRYRYYRFVRYSFEETLISATLIARTQKKAETDDC